MKDEKMIWGFLIQLGHNMWSETLAENGVTAEGDVTTIRLTSGKTIRFATFRNLYDN